MWIEEILLMLVVSRFVLIVPLRFFHIESDLNGMEMCVISYDGALVNENKLPL